MRVIKQDDVIDVIYDSWYGLPLDEADKVVRDYVHRKLIPVEWIKEWIKTEPLGIESLIDPEYTIKAMLYWWEKENDKE